MSELVRVAVVPNPSEADLLCNRLKVEGIAAMRRQTNFGAGAFDAVGGQQEVLVKEDDLERARELIDGD
jgi:Putative prokaryotic signal transducing protein